jgi:hypothetical protein
MIDFIMSPSIAEPGLSRGMLKEDFAGPLFSRRAAPEKPDISASFHGEDRGHRGRDLLYRPIAPIWTRLQSHATDFDALSASFPSLQASRAYRRPFWRAKIKD